MGEGKEKKPQEKRTRPRTEAEIARDAANQNVSDAEATTRIADFYNQAEADRAGGKKRGKEMTDVPQKVVKWWEKKKGG